MKYPKNNAGLRAQLNIMQYMLHVIKEISVQVILLQKITSDLLVTSQRILSILILLFCITTSFWEKHA